jgi:HEAT repeat protein
MMKKTFTLLALLAATAATAAPPRATVEKLLGGYEPKATAADLQRLGEGTDRVLIEIAADPRTPGVRKLRALYALGFVPTEAGRAHCMKVIRDEGGKRDGIEVLDVKACAMALGSFGPASRLDLVPLLAHPSSEVRLGAARGLEKAKSFEAIDAIKRQLGAEPDEVVRDALTRALRASGGK